MLETSSNINRPGPEGSRRGKLRLSRALLQTGSPVGPTHNADDWEVFRVSPSNGIDHTEATHCEGNHTASYSLGSGIAICCIASICGQHRRGQLQQPSNGWPSSSQPLA